MMIYMKKIIKILKKIIISSFLLYGYNIMVAPLNLVIPINIYSLSAITILGVPALIALSLILLFVY